MDSTAEARHTRVRQGSGAPAAARQEIELLPGGEEPPSPLHLLLLLFLLLLTKSILLSAQKDGQRQSGCATNLHYTASPAGTANSCFQIQRNAKTEICPLPMYDECNFYHLII